MWKIVAIDNFSRDEISDYLVVNNIDNKEAADIAREYVQQKYGGEQASRYFVVHPQDKPLYVFEP